MDMFTQIQVTQFPQNEILRLQRTKNFIYKTRFEMKTE